MILTPIAYGRLEATLATFAGSLADAATRAVLHRLARLDDAVRAQGETAIKNHSDTIDIITKFGINVSPSPPQADVSWDGAAFRSATEAYVLLHEVAHYQLAAPDRRHRVDFGLGPGPETGDRDRAAQAQTLFGLAREREEALASLLGILWEAELGHPALASLLDQNWLEGAGRASAAAHFAANLALLRGGGFVDRYGRPQMRLRDAPATSV